MPAVRVTISRMRSFSLPSRRILLIAGVATLTVVGGGGIWQALQEQPKESKGNITETAPTVRIGDIDKTYIGKTVGLHGVLQKVKNDYLLVDYSVQPATFINVVPASNTVNFDGLLPLVDGVQQAKRVYITGKTERSKDKTNSSPIVFVAESVKETKD